jgi:transporter family protein
MKPEFYALLTAMAWGVGGYFEKQGLHLGHLSPQMGITLRTAVAFVLLGAVSASEWRTLSHAGPRALLYLIAGGGIVAGTVGMLSFYAAIKGAPLVKILPIAFTSPLFGAAMGIWLGGEPVTARVLLGMGLTVGGIVLLTTG